MDSRFLRVAARVTWHTDLSPLLEHQAKLNASLNMEGSQSEAAHALNATHLNMKTLSCPSCSTLWIPGLTMQARVRAHNKRKFPVSQGPVSAATVDKRSCANQRVSSLRNKNKRARLRAKNKRCQNSNTFETRLISKMGSAFNPRTNIRPRFIHFMCLNDCDGNLILPIKDGIEHQRNKMSKTGIQNAIKRKILPVEQNLKPPPTSAVSRNACKPMGKGKDAAAANDKKCGKKGGRLSLSDLML